MSNRILTLLTICVLIGIGLLLAINYMNVFTSNAPDRYLSQGDVRGAAVQHKGKLYTLNFQQQNALIDYINRSLETNRTVPPEGNPNIDFDKIIVYRFNAGDIDIKPVDYVQSNLVFLAPVLHKDVVFLDTSAGSMKTMLSETYDP